MKIVNRGFISIHHRQEYWDWANKFNAEVNFSEEDEMEGNVYLISEDIFDVEPIIEQNFKKIFETELLMVTDDEEDYPEKITMELFLKWFKVEVGSTVIDTEKSD